MASTAGSEIMGQYVKKTEMVSDPPKVWLVVECGPEPRCPDHSPPVLLPLDKIPSRSEQGTQEWHRRLGDRQKGQGGHQDSQFQPKLQQSGFKNLALLLSGCETLGPFT